jgi:hypothetical protein
MKTEAASKTAYETFENYIRFIKRFPEVQFVTATDLGKIYYDPAKGKQFRSHELQNIAKGVGDNISFVRTDECTLSAAEALALLNLAFLENMQARDFAGLKLDRSPLGPTGELVNMRDAITTDASQFVRTAQDVQDYLRRHGRVPSAIWLGSAPITPEAYLATLARLVRGRFNRQTLPDQVEVRPAKLAAGKHAFPDDPSLWGWVIFPPGFRAPAMMELARKQTWTIKPAINHGN